jgi:hypothetical protein
MTIHLPLNTTLPELRRVLELIQKQTTTQLAASQATTVAPSGGSSAVSGSSTGTQGPKGDTGAAGAPGSAANLLVGANHQIEVLFGPDGSVLTDNLGYALIGVNVSSTIITGADTLSIGVLNAT